MRTAGGSSDRESAHNDMALFHKKHLVVTRQEKHTLLIFHLVFISLATQALNWHK